LALGILGGSLTPSSKSSPEISETEYRVLSEFRYQLSAFLRRRRDAAQAAGLEPQQYELLLAIKGLAPDKQPTIKQIAEQLKLQHHSAVELVNRMAKRGLVCRNPSSHDRRAVLLSLTRPAEKVLQEIARYSLSQLQLEAPQLLKTLGHLLKTQAGD
jgi:DNA-binding MarR family transcriptional regulator